MVKSHTWRGCECVSSGFVKLNYASYTTHYNTEAGISDPLCTWPPEIFRQQKAERLSNNCSSSSVVT